LRQRWRMLLALLLVVGMVAPTLLPPWIGVARAAAPVTERPARIELQDFRTQYSKRFRNPDGTLTEEVHISSLHYRDQASGVWQEIDTTLVPAQDGPFAYVTRANRFAAHLAETTGADALLKIAFEGRELSLTPVGMLPARATPAGNQATYRQVLPATDLQYLFGPDDVKELITLHSPAAARGAWRFRPEATGLEPREDGLGNILLLDEAGNRRLEMARPMIYDAAGATTMGTLTLHKEAGITFVDLTVDTAWLRARERRYPVTIDPSISPSQSPFAGKDTFVADASDSNFSTSYSLETGKDTYLGRGITRSLVAFNLPGLPSSAWVSNATLTLTEYSGNLPAADVDLYRVTSDWQPTATWNTQPSIHSTKETTTTVNGAGEWSWNITNLVTDWYFNKQANFGVQLRYADESLFFKAFRSSRWTTVSQRPKLTITYTVNPLGWEKFWGYGGNMNVANGNMIMSATDTAVPARGLTPAITRTYNSRSTHDGPFGYGWTTEIDMRLQIPAMANGEPRGPIAYIDLDRTIHYFAQNADGTYASPPGLYLMLVRDSATGTYSVTEKNGLVYKYAADGKITSITDKNGNAITFTYNHQTNPAWVASITDPAGRTLQLNWNATTGKVESVFNQANTETRYEYTNGNLTSVTSAYGTPGAYRVEYTYDANHT
jgi:hypothetical protein